MYATQYKPGYINEDYEPIRNVEVRDLRAMLELPWMKEWTDPPTFVRWQYASALMAHKESAYEIPWTRVNLDSNQPLVSLVISVVLINPQDQTQKSWVVGYLSDEPFKDRSMRHVPVI